MAPNDVPVEIAPARLLPSGELAPGGEGIIDNAEMLKALRYMMISRLADEMAVSLQRQGRINIHAPTKGQEAAVMGSALALDPTRDWLVPQYREFPAYLHHGMPLVALWLNRLGVGSANTVPADLRMLPVQISIAAQLPQAAGLAWGLKLRGTDSVVIAYFGDGAASEGDFHEAANLAAVMDAPLIMFCQANGWAISTPQSRQTAATSLATRAAGYGMPGVSVDGNDLVSVYEVTRAAVDRARSGEGPTLIEAKTQRTGMHNTADDPTRYMHAEQRHEWDQLDPLIRVQQLAKGLGLIDEADLEQLADRLRQELKDTLREAEALAKNVDPLGLIFDNVYDQPSPRQSRQRSQAQGGLTNA